LKVTRFGELNYSLTNFFDIFEKIDSKLFNEFIFGADYSLIKNADINFRAPRTKD